MSSAIVKLSSQEFHVAGPVFIGLDYHLAVPSVLNQSTTGQVWVDRADQPQSGLLRTGHRCYLGGAPDAPGLVEGLTRLFAETILPDERQRGNAGVQVYFDPGWQDLVQTILPDCKLYPGKRQYYEIALTGTMVLPQPDLPAGFQLAAVNQTLLNQPDLGSRDELIEEMHSERASVDDFLQHSFGVCLLYEGAVAGWCLSEYNLEDRCEVGIATADPYRMRGLATMQGLFFLRQALKAGMRRVGWHCWANNVGSARTAQKLGLDWMKDYPSFFAEIIR